MDSHLRCRPGAARRRHRRHLHLHRADHRGRRLRLFDRIPGTWTEHELLLADGDLHLLDGHARPQQRPSGALRLLGADLPGLVLPHRQVRLARSSAGAAHHVHHLHRRIVPPGGHRCDHRSDRHHERSRGTELAGLVSPIAGDELGRSPHRRCSDDQVGSVPVPLVAARCDGRCYSGLRVSARGRRGQGRHLPAVAFHPGIPCHAGVEHSAHRRRSDHCLHRRVVRPQSIRRQEADGLFHGLSAGTHHCGDRHRLRGSDRRRDVARHRPRPLQIRSVHDGRRRRSPRRNPRTDPNSTTDARGTGIVHRHDRRLCLHVGHTAAARVRVEGGTVHCLRRYSRFCLDRVGGSAGGRRCLGAHFRLLREDRVGCVHRRQACGASASGSRFSGHAYCRRGADPRLASAEFRTVRLRQPHQPGGQGCPVRINGFRTSGIVARGERRTHRFTADHRDRCDHHPQSVPRVRLLPPRHPRLRWSRRHQRSHLGPAQAAEASASSSSR